MVDREDEGRENAVLSVIPPDIRQIRSLINQSTHRGPGVKRPSCEVGPSPVFSAEMYAWDSVSTPPQIFLA
jgi:hypothetical protein